jgi:DMSO reductase family type II enzyme heme b subunit
MFMSWARNPLLRLVAGRRLVAGLILASGFLLVVGGLYVVFRGQTEDHRVPIETGKTEEDSRLTAGRQLYGNYCAACHGDKGDGNGPAARYLYPKPRNFTEGRFRYVSTVNKMPSDEDLLQVITRGMPGSAMFPFAHLAEADRLALVGYVRHLTQTGWLERKIALAGGEVDAETRADMIQEVAEVLQPGEPLAVPVDLRSSEAESVARGEKLYRTEACATCHGPTGKGDGTQEQRDDQGVLIRPRDFTQGVFKGGHDPRQLYTRLLLGIPGTPMPAYGFLQPEQTADLIHFILSLSTAEARTRVEHRRTQVIAKRVPEPLAPAIADSAWQAAKEVRLTVSPLWWRNYADPDLQVAALHDGQTLALRLTWRDETRNDSPVRPQDFEDMAAVQLFQGNPEPFLGMGATGQALDVWLWRPSWQEIAAQRADVDTAYPNMAVDLYPFEQVGGGARPHAAERQPRGFLTAWAAGNLQADPTRNANGSNLGAKGFGTLTLRPPVSQVVTTQGEWKDARWTVVLRRSLAVSAEAGIPLAPGDRFSIAFALWDGAAGDRNGQKLVSIWHDLLLE